MRAGLGTSDICIVLRFYPVRYCRFDTGVLYRFRSAISRVAGRANRHAMYIADLYDRRPLHAGFCNTASMVSRYIAGSRLAYCGRPCGNMELLLRRAYLPGTVDYRNSQRLICPFSRRLGLT